MNIRRQKGFTLIEVIVVIAIIGILMAILVPSMLGYVRKSRRTHDMSTGRRIIEDANALMAEKEETFNSFYKESNETKNPQHHKIDPVTSDPYDLYVVAVMNGGPGCTGSYYAWHATEPEYQDFVDAFNDDLGYDTTDTKTKLKIAYKPKGAAKDVNRWFLCYRSDNNDIEIWVGNGGSQSNGLGDPMYRAYPKPAY